MDIQPKEEQWKTNKEIAMDYTKWHAGVYNILYFDSLCFA